MWAALKAVTHLAVDCVRSAVMRARCSRSFPVRATVPLLLFVGLRRRRSACARTHERSSRTRCSRTLSPGWSEPPGWSCRAPASEVSLRCVYLARWEDRVRQLVLVRATHRSFVSSANAQGGCPRVTLWCCCCARDKSRLRAWPVSAWAHIAAPAWRRKCSRHASRRAAHAWRCVVGLVLVCHEGLQCHVDRSALPLWCCAQGKHIHTSQRDGLLGTRTF